MRSLLDVVGLSVQNSNSAAEEPVWLNVPRFLRESVYLQLTTYTT